MVECQESDMGFFHGSSRKRVSVRKMDVVVDLEMHLRVYIYTYLWHAFTPVFLNAWMVDSCEWSCGCGDIVGIGS